MGLPDNACAPSENASEVDVCTTTTSKTPPAGCRIRNGVPFNPGGLNSPKICPPPGSACSSSGDPNAPPALVPDCASPEDAPESSEPSPKPENPSSGGDPGNR